MSTSPQLHCKASQQREDNVSLPNPQLIHELTRLVPSGTAEQQALQQQALHQAALHHHSLRHQNDHHTQQQPCSTDGTQHLLACHSRHGTHNPIKNVEFMEADSPSASHLDAISVGADDEEGQAGDTNLSKTLQFDNSCDNLDALQQTDFADCKMAGKALLRTEERPNTCHGSSISDAALEKLEQAKDCYPLINKSDGCRNWSKVGDFRPKCRVMDSCNDDENDHGASTTKGESIIGLKAGLIHAAHKMPKNAHAHFVLGLMYQRLEQPAKAASAFQKADDILKKSEAEFGQSRSQMLSIVQCHYAMTMLQTRVAGNAHLGTHLQSTEVEGWVKILKLAVERDPCYSLVWNTLGLVFFQIGQKEIAISIFKSLLYAIPNCLDAFANLGAVYLHRGSLANAARCLQFLLEKDSAYPGALLNYATLLLHQYGSSFAGIGVTGDGALQERTAETAQNCLIAALNLNPKAGHLWASLSASYSLLCDSFKSTKCLEQAYNLEPTRLSIRYAVAMQRVRESQINSAGSEGLSWAANEFASILRVGDSAAIQPHVASSGLAKVLRLQHEIIAPFEGDEMYLRESKARAYQILQQVRVVIGTLEYLLDADFAGHPDCRKSTSGYVFTFTGGAVSWISRLQKCVALSTTEAEYVATTEASKEALWLMRLVEELGIKSQVPVLHCDSQSAIMLARNPVFHAKTKHIEVKYHFLRSVLDDKIITLVKVHTDDNPADLLTKSLPAERFAYCRQMMGIG
ncbi:hypothetical protein L7F22_055506 [Adiantum nelumboides]|nr:hypothetical protein [Adiantum nelumboides]